MIPPRSAIVRGRYLPASDEYGNRLYVVMSRQHAQEPGQEAWAGLGWVQEPADGRGLFVECHGTSREVVGQQIEATLAAMMESRGRSYGPIDCEIVGRQCSGRPVCALAIAVYRSEGWR